MVEGLRPLREKEDTEELNTGAEKLTSRAHLSSPHAVVGRIPRSAAVALRAFVATEVKEFSAKYRV